MKRRPAKSDLGNPATVEPSVPAAPEVRIVRVLTIGRLGDGQGAAAPESTPAQRLDQLERLRRQTAKAMGHAYQERLQRVMDYRRPKDLADVDELSRQSGPPNGRGKP